MAFAKKAYNGITEKTPLNLQLDAGAIFKNFEVGTDTYSSAKAAGKCLGATQGGGTFTAKPTLRTIDVDGAVGRIKGLVDIESWECSLAATFIETTVDTLRMALTSATATAGKSDGGAVPGGYTEIKGNAGISDTDYIENLTWIGCISGSNDPMIIQLSNGLNEDGLSMDFAPKSEGKVKVTLYGYNNLADFETNAVNPPFAIYVPDTEAT